jgi:hypothetical protein
VTAPPVDGAANRAVVSALAAALSLPPGSIKIVRGATARQKLVRFPVSPDELNRCLDSLAAESVHDPTV